jgi:SAM-dependent methyltransferase
LLPPSADPENIFLARRIASLTPARGKTLDVGSGGGSSSFCLHQAGFGGPHLLIDFDPRAAFAVEEIPNSSFERRAFEDLTEESGPFDVIVMSHVLEHSLHPLDWLKHAAKLLSPQGILAIAIPNFGGVYRFLAERDPWIIPPIHLQFFTPHSMRRALESSGLRVRKIASRSYVTLDPVDRKLALKSRLIRRAWNALALGVLNQTARGIVLHAYASRDDTIVDARR